MFSYTITAYTESSTTTVKANSLNETYKIDESLDSAVLVIPRSTQKTLFRRFQPIKIEITDGATTYTHWWVVYTPKTELVGMGATPIYEHTLGLIEPTKYLDKFIQGTLTFTKTLGGSRYTMKDVVDRILSLTPFVPSSEVSTTRLCTLDTTLGTYLDTVEAPQFYIDKKNLREALIEVFRYVNAIPRMNYDSGWVLTADFVNQRHIGITVSSGLADYMSEASGEYFGKKAEVFHENTITTEDEDTPNVFANSIHDILYINGDEYVVGDGNFKLIFNHKIYKLLSIKAKVKSSYSAYMETEIDITDYIHEKREYDTLEYDNANPQSYGSKACSCYWVYGQDFIDGLSTAYNFLRTTLALENIIDHALNDQYSATKDSLWEFTDTVFMVEYIPYIELDRSVQYREDTSDNELNSIMKDDDYTGFIVNPQERINSAFKLTKNVFGQIQRLGVDTVAFALRHRTLAPYNGSNSGIYSLGDYTTDGYFITTVEIIYYTTYVIARYEMSKNWNRIAQFVNINKEFRPYEITLTKSDYTLKRDVIMPIKQIAVSYTTNANHEASDLVTYFMNTFKNTTYELPISGATFQIRKTSYGNEAVFMPLALIAEKNVMKFKLDFKDTKLAGNRVEYKTGKQLKFQVPYTNDDATIDYCKVGLYQSFLDYQEDTPYSIAKDRLNGLVQFATNLPLVYLNYIAFGTSGAIAKKYDQMNIYALESDFITSPGTVGEYYVGLDTLRIWYFDNFTVPYGYAMDSPHLFAFQNEPVYELDEYHIQKDRSEILGISMTMPIIPEKAEVNRFIIGDMLTKDNAFMKAKASGRQLYFQASSTRYTKAKTDNTGSTTSVAPMQNIYMVDNRIQVPSAVYSTYDNYAITDADGNLYLAVNQRNLDGTKTSVTRIYFNFIDMR